MNMDKSWALEEALGGKLTEEDLLGELQFSFLAFLLGQSLESKLLKPTLKVCCSVPGLIEF